MSPLPTAAAGTAFGVQAGVPPLAAGLALSQLRGAHKHTGAQGRTSGAAANGPRWGYACVR